MAVDVGTIRRALADALSPLVEGNANPYVQAQPQPPGFQIMPPSVAFDFSGARGLDEWTFIVQGFVALSGDVGPQMLLDQMVTPNGVKAYLEADRTLGGLVSQLTVRSSGNPTQREGAGGSPMLVVEWSVSMYVAGG